jgi:hypothetical protein
MIDELQNLPDPEIVARAAAEEPAPRLLEDYSEAIETLREKEFTFREIAEWLKNKFGIQADHNSVWRVYTKHMSDIDAHEEAEADENTERDEAIDEAYANGTVRTYVPPTLVSSDEKPVEPVVATKAKKTKKK